MTKTRVPNKTQWALYDIIDATTDARAAWKKATERTDKLMDVVLARSLGTISHDLAVIERKARMALDGEYDER